MKTYDAVIVGAGPAGLATAIELLFKGWSVLILDKASLPRAKVCGGFVGAENRAVLKRYGVLDELEAAGAHAVASACLSTSGGGSVKIPITLNGVQAPGLSVSRKTLDATLLKKAKSLGADVMDQATIASVRPGKVKGLAIRHLTEGVVEMVHARNLVYATGVKRAPGAREEAYCFGVAAMFRHVREMQEDVFLHFIDKGHLGTNRFEEELTNVCYVADKKLFESVRGDLEALFQIFLEQNPYAKKQLGQAERVTQWKGVYVPKAVPPKFVCQEAFLVGDAMDVINPIAGAGITLALAGGALLGQLMASCDPANLPFENLAAIYRKRWKKLFQLRISLSRVWALVGHNVFLANLIMRVFRAKKGLFDCIFKFHHHSSMDLEAKHALKGQFDYAKN